MYYGLGNPEEAINLAQKIYSESRDVETGKLLTKMQSAYVADQLAKQQAGL